MTGRVEELIVVRASAAQAMQTLLTAARLPEWVSPHLTVSPLTDASTLGTGDRFRLHVLGGITFDYLVEATSEREVVLSFRGPWSGRERWSFVPDGAETVVRRVYEVDEGSLAGELAWRTVGRALVIAHFKLELSRFRDAVERHPGPRAEIAAPPNEKPSTTPEGDRPPFPVDDG